MAATYCLVVTNPAALENSDWSANYARVGALITTSPKQGQDFPGTTWLLRDPDLVQDPQWDEATQDYIDGEVRFNLSWTDLWVRLTTAEQMNIIDNSQSQQWAHRMVWQFTLGMAAGQGETVKLTEGKGLQVLDSMETNGVITAQRRSEILNGV